MFVPNVGKSRFVAIAVVLAVGTYCQVCHSAEQGPQRELARRILDTTGVKGGLIAHIGCGDGTLTAALHAGEEYLVHGLDTDAKAVEKARKYIESLGIYGRVSGVYGRVSGVYGRVSVDTFDGRHLPYADNLVNLVVSEDPGDVSEKEILRVLAPLGVA